jgi:hypothetical protein
MTKKLFPPEEANAWQSLLDRAIEREDWELAALYIVEGALTMIRALPEASIDEMLEMLDAEEGEGRHRRRGRRGRHGSH